MNKKITNLTAMSILTTALFSMSTADANVSKSVNALDFDSVTDDNNQCKGEGHSCKGDNKCKGEGNACKGDGHSCKAEGNACKGDNGCKAAKKKASVTEKCADVVKKGKNACEANGHSCAGQSQFDNQPNEWVKVPTGTCSQIVSICTKKVKPPKGLSKRKMRRYCRNIAKQTDKSVVGGRVVL